ncbi:MULTISPECIES: hypothetical protein [unclassified Frankia]|uniref:hypothetical protein n=1 Tax=unclassified Frankia TaxID=2632575 RepID=UPI001EF4CA2E|nr:MULTISPECIES: hypothetical protein [unclassified Frankia]
MIVPVALMRGVAVPLVRMVDMVAVWHRHMPTTVTMSVGVPIALPVFGGLALVCQIRAAAPHRHAEISRSQSGTSAGR